MKFKREYIYFLIFIICGASVIWLGNIREVIRGRRITIAVSDAGGGSLSSVRVFAELARSGKTVVLSNNPEHNEQWFSGKVFIKKIVLGITRADLQRVSRFDITIGEESFHFSDARQWNELKLFDKSLLYPSVKNENNTDYVILEVPKEVRLEISKFPFKKDFFVSLINWGGDAEILVQSFMRSLIAIIIFILMSIIIGIILRIYTNKSTITSVYEIDVYKRKFIIFVLTIILTTIAIFLIGALVVYFYRPDNSRVLNEISLLIPDFYMRALQPKPVERLQFVLSVLLSPIILALCYSILKNRSNKRIDVDHIYAAVLMITGILLFAIIYAGLIRSKFLYIRSSYYFDYNGRYIFNLIIFPLLLLLFLFYDETVNNSLKSVHKFIKIILQAIFSMTIILILAMNIFNVEGTFLAYHLNPVVFPVAQVVAGKVLLVNLASQYGLYPLFLSPLFRVIGLSILKFSFVMGLLLVTSYLFLFMFMRRAINDKLLLYSSFLGMIYYSYLAHPIHPDVYFQYWPIRFLFPSLFLFLTEVYLRTKRKYLYYVSFILYSLGILWNFDTGIIVFLSWIMALSYDALSDENHVTEKYLKIVRHIFNALVSLAIIFLGFFVWTYILSGSWPHIFMLLQYQKVFLSGFGLIPMLFPPHPWTFIVLIYLSGFLFVISRGINLKKVERDNKLIFILSVLGVGLFSYYEGRSHDSTLFLPSYPAFILIAIFADKLYTYIKGNGSVLYGDMLVFTFLFYIIISAPFNILYNMGAYFGYAKAGVLSLNAVRDSVYAKNIDFIKKNVNKGEGVLILSPNNDGIYYSETETHSIIDISSFTDPVFKRDIYSIIKFFESNKENKVFAEQPLSYYDLYDPRIKKMLESNYTVAERGKNGLDYYKKINK